MKRLIFAVIMAMFFFGLLNFIYCNLGEQSFGYEVAFRFVIPGLLAFQSTPIPLGFIVLFAFCTGMITMPLIEALPSLYKTLELRSKNKKIRQLERELMVVRQMADSGQKSGEKPPFTSGFPSSTSSPS